MGGSTGKRELIAQFSHLWYMTKFSGMEAVEIYAHAWELSSALRLQVLLRPRHGHAAPYPYAAVIVPHGIPRVQGYTYRLWVSFSWCRSHGTEARESIPCQR